MNKKIKSEIAIGIILFLAIVVSSVIFLKDREQSVENKDNFRIDTKDSKQIVEKKQNEVVCVQSEDQCPDGSQVIRAAARLCESVQCTTIPGEKNPISTQETLSEIKNWNTFKKNDCIIEFKYPKDLVVKENKYISPYRYYINLYPKDYNDPILLPKMEIRFSIYKINSDEFKPINYPDEYSTKGSVVIGGKKADLFYTKERKQYYLKLENDYFLEIEQYVDFRYLNELKPVAESIIKSIVINNKVSIN